MHQIELTNQNDGFILRISCCKNVLIYLWCPLWGKKWTPGVKSYIYIYIWRTCQIILAVPLNSNLTADNGDPYGRYIQTGLADWVGKKCHMGRFLIFPIPVVPVHPTPKLIWFIWFDWVNLIKLFVFIIISVRVFRTIREVWFMKNITLHCNVMLRAVWKYP
jgi:hypothetical protein